MTARSSSLCLMLLMALSWWAPAARAQETSAKSCWEAGQAALRKGNSDQAIACFEQCLRLDPTNARAHLSLAAAFMDRGDERSALPHLAEYVKACPQHVVIRANYADMLLRLDLVHEARVQFEQCIALAQDRPDAELTFLLQSHSKLMEIAQAADDEYAEHLHRGIGLYLLASARSQLPDAAGEVSSEGLLCRALEELKQAAALRAKEAQPHWYLYLTWQRLTLRASAVRALKQADRAAAFSYLTPAEEHELQLAARKLDDDAHSQAPGR